MGLVKCSISLRLMTHATLQNTHILVEVNTKGAEISQFRNLYKTQEVLWNPDFNFWNRTAPLLFPVVGKLKNDQFKYNANIYSMKQHGFARDAEFELVEQTATLLHLRLISNPNTQIQYPFDFQLDVKYTLKDSQLQAENIITNLGDDTMPVSFGAHPGFSIQLPVDTCKIIIHREGKETPTEEILQRHLIAEGLYTGETEPVKIQNGEIPLNENYFEHDAIVFKNAGITGMSLVQNGELIARLDAPNAPYWGIWKKPGAPFVCIEPWWGIADHSQTQYDLLTKEGVHLLEKHDALSIKYDISTQF